MLRATFFCVRARPPACQGGQSLRGLQQIEGTGNPPARDKGGPTGILTGILQRVAGHPTPQEIFGGRAPWKVGCKKKTITRIRSCARFSPFQDDVLQDVLQRVVA